MASSANTPAIALRRFSQPASVRLETVELGGDDFVMSLPLCRGSVTLRCDRGTIYNGDVRPGMLRVTAPGESVRVRRHTAAEAFVLSIPGTLVRSVAAEGGHRRDPSGLTAVAPVVEAHPQVERLTSALLGHAEIDGGQRSLFIEGIALALLAVALGPRRAPGRRAGGLSPADFARCIDYADAHLGDKVDVATWAAAIGLSPGEFVRRFGRTAQLAPYAWLLNWRIDRAKQMLERPGVTLAQAALSVGFSSQSHFTEAFRQRTGMPPGRWRNMLRGSR